MRNLGVIWAVLLTAGCGSGDESPAERLVGGWGVMIGGCAEVIVFGSDGRYETRTACSSSSAALEVEAQTGSYHASDEALAFDKEASSCEEPERQVVLRYSVEGHRLSLIGHDATIVYQWLEDPEAPFSNGLIVYGCYDGGDFVRRPVGQI